MKSLKFKPYITYLSVITLALIGFSQLLASFTTINVDFFDGGQSFALALPNATSLLHLIFNLAPCALLLGYIVKLCTHPKANIVEAGIFALTALYYLYDVVSALIEGTPFNVYILFGLVMILTFGAVVVVAFKKMDRIPFPLIACAVGIVYATYYMINDISFYAEIREEYTSINPDILRWLLIWFAGDIGHLVTYVTLFLISLKNKFPSLVCVSVAQQMKKVEKATPEQALKLLKEQYELGTITEDEYKQKRQEIIATL